MVVSPTFHGIVCHTWFPLPHCRALPGPFPWLQCKIKVEERRYRGLEPPKPDSTPEPGFGHLWFVLETGNMDVNECVLHPVPYTES